MVWIFAAGVLLLALLSRRLRKFGLVLSGATVIVIVAVILLNERSKTSPAPAAPDSKVKAAVHSKISNFDDYLIERQDKDDPEAKNRIALSEVKFGQITPTFGPQADAIQSVQARLYNGSKRFSLTDYAYYLTIQDCVESKPNDASTTQCTTVYDQRRRGTPVVIPPNQARDITISIPVDSVTFAPSFKILGKPLIELTPTDTRAYRSSEHPQTTDGAAGG
ncbi:MAG: hypothetical protein JWN43_2816 [Gammaproteobacteria bacterium]|nr:hypothetical protein [Gammaproteobacteria bacterium]